MSLSFKNIVNTGNNQNPPQGKQTSSYINDELLWKLFKKGDESAFVDIYNQHFQTLYDYGRQLSGDLNFVKDCVQEVFISMRIKRAKLPFVSSVKAYLLKATRNKILTEIKKNKTYQFVDVDKCSLNFLVIPSHENVLIKRQFNDSQIKQIQKVLCSLSTRRREAIYHFYYSNLSYNEIKDIMNLGSTKAARNIIYRAMAQIRKSLIGPDQ